jgi:hypothetical protein
MTEMIFTRTKDDVDNALRLRAEKVQTFEELTEEEIETLEHGTLTINTLNRIENKQKELVELFENDFYFVETTEHKTWGYSDFFTENDFNRILSNLNKLKKAYFVYKDTPRTPSSNYRHYQVINDVEKILYDLEEMIEDLKNHYRQCGAYECGEENI